MIAGIATTAVPPWCTPPMAHTDAEGRFALRRAADDDVAYDILSVWAEGHRTRRAVPFALGAEDIVLRAEHAAAVAVRLGLPAGWERLTPWLDVRASGLAWDDEPASARSRYRSASHAEGRYHSFNGLPPGKATFTLHLGRDPDPLAVLAGVSLPIESPLPAGGLELTVDDVAVELRTLEVVDVEGEPIPWVLGRLGGETSLTEHGRPDVSGHEGVLAVPHRPGQSATVLIMAPGHRTRAHALDDAGDRVVLEPAIPVDLDVRGIPEDVYRVLTGEYPVWCLAFRLNALAPTDPVLRVRRGTDDDFPRWHRAEVPERARVLAPATGRLALEVALVPRYAAAAGRRGLTILTAHRPIEVVVREGRTATNVRLPTDVWEQVRAVLRR